MIYDPRMVACGIAALLLSGSAAVAQTDLNETLAMSKPGAAHEILKMMAGTWKQKVTSFMDPSGNPVSGSGTATNQMILGDRFLQINSTSTLAGTTVSSLTILGYDNRVGKYFTFGIDEMGTYAVTAEGAYDAATKTIMLRGKEKQGEMTMDFTFAYTIISKNAFTLTLSFDMPDGKKLDVVKVEFTR